MSALSPKARDLITRGRGGPPSAGDRARVRAKLDDRLALVAAAGVVAGAAKTASATTASATTVLAATGSAATTVPAAGAGTAVVAAHTGTLGFALKIGLAVLALGAAGVTFEVVRSHHTEPTAPAANAAASAVDAPAGIEPVETTPVADSSSTAPSDDNVSPGDSATPSDSAAPPSPAALPSGRLPRSRDPASIAAEVALLRRAQSALAKGDPNASLRAIDAIETAHPSGALREETSAARVLALCAAGKKAEAKAEAARFLAQWPSSVQASRVRGSCAFTGETDH